jgi:hypothetical protein
LVWFKKSDRSKNVTIWHTGKNIDNRVGYIGMINSTIYLAGFQHTNEVKLKRNIFDQLVNIDTKNKLMRTANWLAQRLVSPKSNKIVVILSKANLDDAQENIMTYLKNYSPMPSRDVQANEFDKIN